jgi:hypothetical protein
MTIRNRLAAFTFAVAVVGTVSSPARVTGAPSWMLGTIDQSFTWVARENPVPAIDACAGKASERSCLLKIMRAGGASQRAMAFTRWYYAAFDGDSAFIVHVRKSRFGAVSIASVELPGRANDNFIYIFVNGTPMFVNPNNVFDHAPAPWAKNKAFLAIAKTHPNANVFPEEALVGESARPGGSQRYRFAFPIVDGCHACARVGIVYVDYDFAHDGSAAGSSVNAIHECPSSDVRCETFVSGEI